MTVMAALETFHADVAHTDYVEMMDVTSMYDQFQQEIPGEHFDTAHADFSDHSGES